MYAACSNLDARVLRFCSSAISRSSGNPLLMTVLYCDQNKRSIEQPILLQVRSTRRWRKADSNRISRDSLPERNAFERSVPRQTGNILWFRRGRSTAQQSSVHLLASGTNRAVRRQFGEPPLTARIRRRHPRRAVGGARHIVEPKVRIRSPAAERVVQTIGS